MKMETANVNNGNDSYSVQTSESPSKPETIYYRAAGDHLLSDLDGECVVLSLKNGKYYGLNSVGSRLWELLQAPISAAEIETAILSEYAAEPLLVKKEISSFLEKMTAEELVEVSNEANLSLS